MQLKWNFKTGKDLSRIYLDAFQNPETDFQLTAGEIYIVYGINIWRGSLNYLVTSMKWADLPYWTPAELFSIIDDQLDPSWYFRFYGYSQEQLLNAIWSYKEMVVLDTHYEDLIERSPEALNLFNHRKMEMDSFYLETEK